MKSLPRSLFVFATLLVVLFLSASAKAERRGRGPGTFGLGLGAGTLTRLGLSAKYFMGDTALQANVGCGGWSCSSVGLSADYLFEVPPLIKGRVLDIGLGAGFGAGVGLHDHPAIAAAGVIGLEGNFNSIPLDLVVEWRPTLLFVPDTHLKLDEFTGHVRVYLF